MLRPFWRKIDKTEKCLQQALRPFSKINYKTEKCPKKALRPRGHSLLKSLNHSVSNQECKHKKSHEIESVKTKPYPSLKKSKKGCESRFLHYFLTDFTKFFFWGSTLLDFGFLTKKASWIHRIFKIWYHGNSIVRNFISRGVKMRISVKPHLRTRSDIKK